MGSTSPAGGTHRPDPRPHGVARRAHRHRRRRLPRHRGGAGPHPHPRPAFAAGVVDGLGGRRRPAVRPGAPAPDAVRQPHRLRRARGTRHGAAHLRQPPVARHPHGRAAAAGGRVAAQDARARLGGGVDRLGRPSRAHRLGPRRARDSPHADRRGVRRGGARRGHRHGLGGDLAAGAPEGPRRRRGAGGAHHAFGPGARADRGGARRRAAISSPPTTTPCSPSWPARWAWPCTTWSSTRPSRSRSTRCGARPTSCGPRGPASWPPPTRPAARSSATSTTAPSSTWWRWP